MEMISSWVSAAAAVAAALFAGLAYWRASRDAASASKAADRSAVAAEAAATAQTKIADRFTPAWTLERREDSGPVRLRNDNGEAAFDVQIAADPWYFAEGSAEHSVIPAGSSVAFILMTDDEVDWDTMVSVTWHRRKDMSDPAQVWQEPVLWRMW